MQLTDAMSKPLNLRAPSAFKQVLKEAVGNEHQSMVNNADSTAMELLRT